MLKQMKHILSSTQNGHRPAAAPGVTSRTAGQEKRQQHASRGTTDLVAQRGMGRSSRPGPENHADNSYPGRRRSPDEKPKSSSNTKPPRSPSPGPDDDSYPDNTYSGRGSPDGEPQNSSDKEPQNFSDTGSARSPSRDPKMKTTQTTHILAAGLLMRSHRTLRKTSRRILRMRSRRISRIQDPRGHRLRDPRMRTTQTTHILAAVLLMRSHGILRMRSWKIFRMKSRRILRMKSRRIFRIQDPRVHRPRDPTIKSS
jgi:hypothetical protein